MKKSVTLLNAVEITGTGTSKPVKGNPPYTVQVVLTNSGGSVTALAVQLEGSLDDDNFASLHDNEAPYVFTAADLAAKSAVYHIANRGVDFVQGNITTLTETGNTAVTMYFKGN